MSCGLQGLFGLGLGMGNGKGGPGGGLGPGQINKLDKEVDIKASSMPMAVRGDRQAKGTETYIEIKGPTGLGSKSSTPYYKVLPKYKKQAEEAIDRQKIPKQHQKRVKKYFDSLAGGGG